MAGRPARIELSPESSCILTAVACYHNNVRLRVQLCVLLLAALLLADSPLRAAACAMACASNNAGHCSRQGNTRSSAPMQPHCAKASHRALVSSAASEQAVAWSAAQSRRPCDSGGCVLCRNQEGHAVALSFTAPCLQLEINSTTARNLAVPLKSISSTRTLHPFSTLRSEPTQSTSFRV
jgi:hypothetical protein